MTLTQRVFADLGAIACWLVLWGISAGLSTALCNWAKGPESGMFIFFVGFLFISPVGFACSTFFLWIRRDVRLFIASAVLVGLATGLAPLILMVID